MWNSLELESPSSDLVAYPPPDHCILENLRDFVTVLTISANTLTSDSPLWIELNVLQNIQAKYKRILRCDRFLVFLQRVGHCLRKMVLINLSKSYLDLAERFLIGFQDLSGTPHLPSRQQVEYVLLRTLTASRLVCEAINYSRESFCYIIQKLKVGHLILDLIMATSVIARLNILLRATLEQLSSMYKQVLFWRYKVKKGEFQWAEKFDFPQDIEEWVKSSKPAYLKPVDMSKEDMDRIKSILKKTDVSKNNKTNVSDTESIILVSDEDSSTNVITIADTDFGEVVARAINEVNPKKKINNVGKVNMNEKTVQKKKVKMGGNLTKLQKSTLQKLIKVQSLKHLEDLWYNIIHSSQEAFPARLTARKKEKIRTLFSEIKATYPLKVFFKIHDTKPQFLEKAVVHVCKKLGFTDNHMTIFQKELDPDLILKSDSADEMPQEDIKMLVVSKKRAPVKNVNGLRVLYDQLKEVLKFKNETSKLKSLKTIFKHRMADIRHLKQQGNRVLAKRLTLCTSKEFLALYQ